MAAERPHDDRDGYADEGTIERAASATTDWPTLVKPHAISDAKTGPTTLVTTTVIASAMKVGMRRLSQC
jgi:hypothetical protein